MRLRDQPQERLSAEIRPSEPVRHLTSLRNRGRRSTARRAALWRPFRTMATNLTPRAVKLGVDLGLAVAPVGGDRPRAPGRRGRLTLSTAGGEQGAVGGVANMHAVVDDDAVFVVERPGPR